MGEAGLRQFDIHLPPVRVHYDFRPIKIRVYRNGDELDTGKDVTVTRREFKHWIIFLDALTKKLGTTTAINRLYTTAGEIIDHFDELQPKGEYVAIERGAFAHCHYGRARKEAAEKFGGSLEKLNKVGKYIWDNEGNGMGEGKQKEEITSGVIHLPKLIGLSDSSSKQTEKEASVENITLPVIDNPIVATRQKIESSKEIPREKKKENGKEEREKSEMKETTRERKERKEEAEQRAGRSTSEEKRQKRIVEEKEAEERKPTDRRQEESQENMIVPFMVQEKSKKKVFNIPNAQPSLSNQYETEKKKKGPGIERIFERSERRIIRELSDDRDEIYKPSRQIVASTSSYKSYLWEARRPYDPDIDY